MNDQKALQEFVSEGEEIIEELYQNLRTIEEGVADDRIDPDALNAVFRGAHSLKGMAGMFGFSGLQGYAHKLEDLLDRLRLGKLSFTTPVLNRMYESVEFLRSILTSLAAGQGEASAGMDAELAKLDEMLADKATEASGNPFEGVDLEPGLLGVLTEYEEYRLKTNIDAGNSLFKVMATFDMMTFDQSLDALTKKLKVHGEVITTLPSSDPAGEDDIKFDLIVGAPSELEALVADVSDEQTTVQEIAQSNKKKSPSSPLSGEVESFLLTQQSPAEEEPVPSAAAPASTSLRSVSKTVRVDIDKLDNIMNVVGELVLYSSQINQFSEKLRMEEEYSARALPFFKAARALERKIRELQDGVMDTRMVPLRQVFDKLHRIVRSEAQLCGKEIDLEMMGAETELDKLIIEDLGDPLMHIIRNSIDHGLETPEEREKAGKDRRGTIRLNAFQRGNHVHLEIHDDGNGIDLNKVRARAEERNLISAADNLKDDEILALLFNAGFSTRDEVSELSGRGVGLDVVKKNIAGMRGLINIETKLGQGTKFILTLPITLAIIRALIIEATGRTYAIPLSSIMTSLMIEPSQIRTIERREVMEFRNQQTVQTLPLLRLERIFGLEAKEGVVSEQAGGELYVVVLELAERRLGLVVDRLHGQQDIVIKSISEFLRNTPGIAGATDLGNQETILVLDAAALIDEATRGV